MKAKQLTVLGGLLAVAIVIALILNKKTDGEPPAGAPAAGDRPFATVPVNDISEVAISGPGKTVTLKREGEEWKVASRSYPADFTKLGNALRKLKELQVADSVRAGESAYGRLEVKEPDVAGPEEQEGAGLLVELRGDGGKELGSAVLGKRFDGASGASGFSSGRYLRERGKADYVYIVSDQLYEFAADPSTWLKRDFFRINKPDDVTVTQADGTVFKFTRENEGDTATMEGISEEEELNPTNTSTVTSPFSSASFRDVVTGEDAAPEKTGLDKPVSVDVTTFEGFTYSIKLGKGPGENTDSDERNATVTSETYYLTVDVSADLPEKREPQDDETAGDDATDEEKEKAKELAEKRDAEFLAEQNNLKKKLETEQAFAGTVFKIDSWVAEKFFKPREELVRAKEKEEESEAAPVGEGLGALAPEPIGEGLGALAPEGDKPKVVATTPPISVADILEGTETATEADAETATPEEAVEEIKEQLEESGEPGEGEGSAEPSGSETGEATESAEDATESADDSGDEGDAGNPAEESGDAETSEGR